MTVSSRVGRKLGAPRSRSADARRVAGGAWRLQTPTAPGVAALSVGVRSAAGQRDSASAEFTAYHRSEGLISAAYDAANLAGSYKRLGELYEAKGDVKRAVELYDKFVALWKNADPELQPVVSDVRRRITRLTPVER